ncbi:hypothetical protein C7401_11631 [Paraburkholderia unamae]|nr:hypothetical protein C7401_11631 [Paraburkholderia unamae]
MLSPWRPAARNPDLGIQRPTDGSPTRATHRRLQVGFGDFQVDRRSEALPDIESQWSYPEVSRPGELHPESLAEPNANLSYP